MGFGQVPELNGFFYLESVPNPPVKASVSPWVAGRTAPLLYGEQLRTVGPVQFLVTVVVRGVKI